MRKRICFLFWKSNFKMALIWKKGYFDLLFTFFSYQGKVTKIPSAQYLTHIQTCILLALLAFLPYQFWKNKKKPQLSGMVSLWCDSQWRSQGLPGWASRPPGRPKWGRKWRKFEKKMRETTGKWGNIEEIFLSCPLGSERLATALVIPGVDSYSRHLGAINT